MTRTRFAAAAIAVFVWLSAEVVRAICPYPNPKVCSQFFESDAVFVARVLSRNYVDNDETLRFDVRVSRTLRGTVSEAVSVYSTSGTGRPNWDVGHDYVVFARLENGRRIAHGDCGPLSESRRIARIVREIEALRGQTTASIEGEVLEALETGSGVPGMVVRIQGADRVYEARSNARGQFRVEVPPGRYTVLPDPSLRQSDYNLWEGLDNVNLVAGQCAQYQFALPHPKPD